MNRHGGDVYQNKNCIDFSININPLGMPKNVKKAACEGVEMSECYPDVDCHILRQSISEKEGMEMDYIICGNGAADLIFTLINSVHPKHVLLPVPSFYEYEKALSMSGCEIQYYAMKEEDGFNIGSDFIEKIGERTDLIFLCNPNNPTGNLVKKKHLEEILFKCQKNSTLLVVDECFMDFVNDIEKFSMTEFCTKFQNLFVLKAFTKLYAMPGLRLGYGICSKKELIENMKMAAQPWSVSVPAQMAGIAALMERKYVADSIKLLEEEKKYLIEKLREMRFLVFGSHANFIFFRFCDTKTQKAIPLWEECKKRGILIRDCGNFRGLSDGFYRIAVKNNKENSMLIQVLQEIIWQNYDNEKEIQKRNGRDD